MKKFLMFLAVAAAVFAVQANDGDWKTTLKKVGNLRQDTGIAGFAQSAPPAYLTGDFDESERPEKKAFAANRNGYYDANCEWHGGYFDENGAFVKGHEIHTLFACPTALASSS